MKVDGNRIYLEDVGEVVMHDAARHNIELGLDEAVLGPPAPLGCIRRHGRNPLPGSSPCPPYYREIIY